LLCRGLHTSGKESQQFSRCAGCTSGSCERFISPSRIDRLWDQHSRPAIRLVLRARPAVKRSGRETDHTAASGTEVNYAWSYTCTLWRTQGRFYRHLHFGNEGRISSENTGCMATDCHIRLMFL
jgi:hypothetical protein